MLSSTLIDELGYLSYGNRHADLLFNIVNRRYEAKPTILTTNYRLPPAEASDEAVVYDRLAGPDQLAGRIPSSLVSRLYEMARIVEIDSLDFRRRVKVHQLSG